MHVYVYAVEIKALTMDTRTAVWVSTPETIVLREALKYSRHLGVVSGPAPYKNPDTIPVNDHLQILKVGHFIDRGAK